MSQPILFIIPGACSLGAQISLEWLEIPYQIGITTPVIRASQEFLVINPTGKVGALKLDHQVVGENLAILLFLADHYQSAKLAPLPASPERAQVYQWLSYLSSTLHPCFQQFNYPERFIDGGTELVEHFRALALQRLHSVLAYIEANLHSSGYFIAEQATIVDAQAYALLRWCRKHKRGINLVDLQPYPQIIKFIQVMEAHTAVSNALLIEQNQSQLANKSKFSGYFQFD